MKNFPIKIFHPPIGGISPLLFKTIWKTLIMVGFIPVSKTSNVHVNYNPLIQYRNVKPLRTYVATPLAHIKV